jgi:site-specific DNA recombinase
MAAIAEPTTSTLAVYMRVSSDEQREHGTIETQRSAAERYLAIQDITPYGWYPDDGVSGTVPFAERSEGARLLADAAAGYVNTVLVWRLDRMGRNALGVLKAVEALEQLHVRLVSITESFDTSTPAGRLQLNMLATIAQFERDSIIQRTNEGINRHLREGGWMGGRIPYGYHVTGSEKDARLAVSHALLDGLGMSEAQVVELMFHLATTARWTNVKIADHLAALGVPTATRWRANRVHAILTNPVYKGLATFGKRKRGGPRCTDGLVTIPVPAIVSPEVWMAAQDALRARQRFSTRNAKHNYLLRGLCRCALCGRVLSGVVYPLSTGKIGRYYVCHGKSGAVALFGSAEADALRCPSTAVRADWLEERIWRDVESYLRDPGPLLDTLAAQMETQADSLDIAKQSLVKAERALAAMQGEQDSVLALYRRGRIDAATLDRQLDAIQREETTLREQLEAAREGARAQSTRQERLQGAGALLRRLQVRLEEPLTAQVKRELIEQLVAAIVVDTEHAGTSRRGKPKKRAAVAVTYSFDEPGTTGIASGMPTRARSADRPSGAHQAGIPGRGPSQTRRLSGAPARTSLSAAAPTPKPCPCARCVADLPTDRCRAARRRGSWRSVPSPGCSAQGR